MKKTNKTVTLSADEWEDIANGFVALELLAWRFVDNIPQAMEGNDSRWYERGCDLIDEDHGLLNPDKEADDA